MMNVKFQFSDGCVMYGLSILSDMVHFFMKCATLMFKLIKKVYYFALQKPDIAGLADFLKPLNEVMTKANRLTEGKRSDYFNHLKSAADSLSALAWIAYTGKDCGN